MGQGHQVFLKELSLAAGRMESFKYKELLKAWVYVVTEEQFVIQSSQFPTF